VSLVRVSVSGLIQGISQQPDAQRDPSQAEAQINAVSSTGDGLRQREGSRSVARVSAAPFGDVLIHQIQRDADEQYLVVIGKTMIRVFDLQGAEKIVAAASGAFDYLSTVTMASRDIRAATVADFTFISNSRRVPAMDSAVAPSVARPAAHEALVWVKAANYGQNYRVNVNGVQATVETAVAPVIVSGSTTTTNKISTEEIAEQLRIGLAAATGVNISRVGSVLHLTAASVISVLATDARANADITAITNSVGALQELPNIAPQGYQVEVNGDPANPNDGYYVAFRPRSGTFGEGSWEETVAPGVRFRLNAATMPHLLVRLANGTFWFGPANGSTQGGTKIPSWGQRTAGDEDSAEDPSFIGKPIEDVLVFRNRLALLADEAIVQGRPRDLFEFFPETVTTVLDSDPIDRTAGSNRVSVLRFAVPSQDELILFSDQGQFRYGTAEVALTPKTADITVLTGLEVDTGCRPIPVQGDVLFVQTNGQYSRVRNFFIRGAGTALVADAGDLTEQVSGYVPAGVFRLAQNDSGNAVFALSNRAGHQNRIYVYKYFIRSAGGSAEKIQSSWSHWEFPAAEKILDIICVEETLYMLVQYGAEVWLDCISATDRLRNVEPAPYPFALDRLVSTTAETPQALRVPTGTFDPIANRTTWPLPWTARRSVQAWSGYSAASDGGVLLGEATSGNLISARGDWATGNPPIWFGEQFLFRYEFSRFRHREEVRGSLVAANEPRTQVRFAELRYQRSRYFRVKVECEGRDPAVYEFDGVTLAVGGSRLGSTLDAAPTVLKDGVFRIPIRSAGERARITIENDTPHPCSFASVEWAAIITSKARRMQ
jgi:hypothetical protein